jgi:NAD(P)-dependent dehydrogenase (short-subunit alcohol dehydrogenase family)
VHCGWPAPDNQSLLDLAEIGVSVEHHVAAPLRGIIALAQMVATNGVPGASLVLVGSTFAEPGRHNYRMPLYSLAKSMLPAATRVLALELGARGKRCVTVAFDVIGGGMNAAAPRAALLSHADRTPIGALPTVEEAARQVAWVLDNPGMLASGALITLSGGALP